MVKYKSPQHLWKQTKDKAFFLSKKENKLKMSLYERL